MVETERHSEMMAEMINEMMNKKQLLYYKLLKQITFYYLGRLLVKIGKGEGGEIQCTTCLELLHNYGAHNRQSGGIGMRKGFEALFVTVHRMRLPEQ